MEEYRELEATERMGRTDLLRQMKAYAGFRTRTGEIADVEVVSMHTANRETIFIALCANSGFIELFDAFGNEIDRIDTKHNISHCSFGTPFDDFRLLIASNAENRLFSYKITGFDSNFTEKVALEPGIEEILSGKVHSLSFAMRMSRKYWVLTEDSGDIVTLHYNGTVMKRAETGLGRVVSTDRGAYQLSLVTEKRLASFHLGSQEVSLLCDETFGKIGNMALEVGAQFAYVAMEDGDVMVYDMKFAPGHGVPTTCKGTFYLVVYRFPSVLHSPPWSMAVVKGNLLVWDSSGTLTFLNTSYIDSDRPTNPIRMQVLPKMESSGQSVLRTFKYQNGTTLVVLGKGREVTLIEAALPSVEQPAGSMFDFSLGNFRIVA